MLKYKIPQIVTLTLPLGDCLDNNKKRGIFFRISSSLRVADGTRTHDIQNHNLTL